MSVTLVFVTSVNGLITDGSDRSIQSWTSVEDQQYFAELKKQSTAIIMGNTTYQANKNRIALSPKQLRVVMTRTPERYRDQIVPDQLEFSKEPPDQLIQRLQKRHRSEILVVGGSQVATAFLKVSLIDTLLITIEPKLFGSGVPLLESFDGFVQLKLSQVEQLNAQGTLLLNYEVIR